MKVNENNKGNKKGKELQGKKKKSEMRKAILFLGVFLTAYIILVTAITPPRYNLKVDEIARQDIKAPRDTVDEKATAEKLQQAEAKVDKQFTQKSEVRKQAEDNIKELFDNLNKLADSTLNENQKIDELKKVKGITLTQDDCKTLITIGKDELAGLEKDIIDIINNIYDKNVGENLESELKPARENAVKAVEELKLNSDLNKVISGIVEKQINTNIFFDKEKTDEMIREVQKTTTKVTIKQNQIIVKEGEPVTQEQIDILSDLGMLDNNRFDNYVQIYLILAVFLGAIMFLQYNYIHKDYLEIYSSVKKLTMISTINLMSLLLARAIGAVNPYLIPFSCAPMVMTLLVNYKLSLVVSTLNVIIISALHGFDVQIIILGIVGAILGSTLLKNMQRRNDLIYSTVYISILSSVLTLSTGLLISSNLGEVLLKTGFTIIGGILSGIFALGLLPFLEGTFKEVTVLTLIELANPNNALLKKLLMEAPGTYHHCMLVANLAEMAADEIGANSMIARIGSYFHDIGKTVKPYYFAENQLSGGNPHSNLSPRTSAKIIINHVKNGVELAQKNNLPKVIVDIIAEHHGTTLVKYFYITAKKNAKNPEEVREEDFRYPGPIPSSKESGIIMMSDSIEAAVRSIKEPTEQKIADMINSIIDDKLSSGQLNRCDLTMNDIEKMRKCFSTALNGIYHHRIEYPKEDEKTLEQDDKKGEIK